MINGNIQSQGGIAVPNGSISFQLNIDATILLTPFGIIPAEQELVFQFDVNGDLVQPARLYSNAELNPQNAFGLGTYYLVTFYDANGARINKSPMWWQFTETANSTVDISQMTAFSTVGGNVIFYPTSFVVPAPTPTTLGGVFSNVGVASNWIRSINTDGTVSLSQPTFSDIAGTISSGQLPSGLIAGTIAANQVAVGVSANTIGGTNNFTWNPTTQKLTIVPGDLVGGVTIDAAAVVTSSSRVILIENIQQSNVLRFVSAAGGVDIQINPSVSPGLAINVANGVGIFGVSGTNMTFQNVGASGLAQSIFQLNNAGAVGGGSYVVDIYGGKNTAYSKHACVKNGLSSIVAAANLTAQTAAITATTILAVTDGTGMTTNQQGVYRISYRASITTAGSISSVLGGTNGFQVQYTDLNDSVVKTSNPTTPIVSSANTTATTISGSLLANCKAGTNLQFLFDYLSSGSAMVYDLDVYVEFLG